MNECVWLKPLFKDNNYWQIGFDGENLVTRYGKVNGVIRETKRKVLLNNSGRTMYEQALLEANQKYNKQEHKGYSNELTTITQYPKPMLANDFDNSKIKAYPILVQPKIDGVRSICRLMNNKVHMRSKEGNEQLHMDQIRDELIKLFAFLPQNVDIDGELYVHGWSFNKLISAVRTGQITKSTKKVRDKNPLNELVNYYIFDLMLDLSAIDRVTLLTNAFNKYIETYNKPKFIVLVPTYIANSYEELIQLHNYFVSEHYEGAMIRHTCGFSRNSMDLTKYRDKRCDNLLKLKVFKDEEGIIVDVIEENGVESNLALFVIKDIRDNVFTVRPKGTFEQRKEWFKNKQDIIGKKYTFRYFELSDHNIPRFPVGIAIRDYE